HLFQTGSFRYRRGGAAGGFCDAAGAAGGGPVAFQGGPRRGSSERFDFWQSVIGAVIRIDSVSGRARREYLPASGGARGMGGIARHGSEPVAHRAVGWRAHPLLFRGRENALAVANLRRAADPDGILLRL